MHDTNSLEAISFDWALHYESLALLFAGEGSFAEAGEATAKAVLYRQLAKSKNPQQKRKLRRAIPENPNRDRKVIPFRSRLLPLDYDYIL
ncbi:hypothetical protein IQ250_24365 [Pseudanabaenaceae cyanobacterium LEGE 13415]|nr:hypothetical protein [Pseudanabaenaceae cyanobacterium LEGE 13415]